MNLYQRLLGHPFVYNHIRPLVVGGIDMYPFYSRVQAQNDDVIVDIGCGTGDALRYLSGFQRYVGFDTDAVAVGFAKNTYGSRPNVEFVAAPCTQADIEQLAPNRIIMCGLLHHLSNEQALDLLKSVKASPGFRRLVTSDIVFLDSEPISNLLARLDRGRYCRREEEYHALVKSAGFTLRESVIVRSHPSRGLAKYLLMTLEADAAQS